MAGGSAHDSEVAPSKGRRAPRGGETWRDWLPAGLDDVGPLLSRPELIARLRAAGVETTVADLRYWEYQGIIPRAVREGRGGKARALYPEWYVYLVAQLRALQRSGHDLSEIRHLLHTLVGRGDESAASSGDRPSWLDAIGYAPAPPELPAALADLARRLERAQPGHAPLQAELRLIMRDGNTFAYLFPLSVNESEE